MRSGSGRRMRPSISAPFFQASCLEMDSWVRMYSTKLLPISRVWFIIAPESWKIMEMSLPRSARHSPLLSFSRLRFS